MVSFPVSFLALPFRFHFLPFFFGLSTILFYLDLANLVALSARCTITFWGSQLAKRQLRLSKNGCACRCRCFISISWHLCYLTNVRIITFRSWVIIFFPFFIFSIMLSIIIFFFRCGVCFELAEFFTSFSCCDHDLWIKLLRIAFVYARLNWISGASFQVFLFRTSNFSPFSHSFLRQLIDNYCSWKLIFVTRTIWIIGASYRAYRYELPPFSPFRTSVLFSVAFTLFLWIPLDRKKGQESYFVFSLFGKKEERKMISLLLPARFFWLIFPFLRVWVLPFSFWKGFT